MSESRASGLDGFFDDAAVFPPGSASLDIAVRDHLGRRSSRIEPFTGPLLLGLDQVPEAHRLALETAGDLGLDLAADPLRIGVVIPEGRLQDALELEALALDGTQVIGLEMKTPAEDWQTALRDLQQADTPASRYAEFTGAQVAQGAVATLQGGKVHLKFRTGGLESWLFPTPGELAEVIGEAVRRQVPFKLTAGLHQAVRHTNDATGFTHHGFLNIALATAAADRGAGPRHLMQILENEDGAALALEARGVSTISWRQWFRSFGTCSIDEPLDSLAALGLDPASFDLFGPGFPATTTSHTPDYERARS